MKKALATALPRGLYGMLDLPSRLPVSSSLPRSIYEPLFAAGVFVLQLRMKDAPAALMLAVLAELKAARPPGTLLIVNDRLDVALAGGADGVHLGQDDLPLSAARPLCPPGFLIGISTHNETQAAAAMDAGADYIGLGPIFATSSKQNPDPVVGVQRLAGVCASAKVPVVAIGGITLERVPELVAAQAHAVAIIAAVNTAPDIRAAALSCQRFFT
jgi:thiamine-phosphate pyrophosphorylase